MANPPKSMRQIRQILQQHLQGISSRQIVKRTGFSSNTTGGLFFRIGKDKALYLTAVFKQNLNNEYTIFQLSPCTGRAQVPLRSTFAGTRRVWKLATTDN